MVVRFQINFYNLTRISYIHELLIVFFSSALVPAACSLKMWGVERKSAPSQSHFLVAFSHEFSVGKTCAH